ncbi:DUF4301 family protein [Sandaracinomonas limnophila]|uniref:DUF4301 family protein n=1 Tax=Sandaracinomonas limnophila TaxID=1862386 RepID=A0A437PMK4_9BACT|nr:DUF4301 family protein [Sandaracinomonas limnophila]RVU23304.1 DUF4301 family protein [Sandaracinomonas limnophila]
MLNSSDLTQLEKRGIQPAEVEQQINYFKNGFPWMTLFKAATPGEGVIQLTADQVREMAQKFDDAKSGLSILKMVPASGAATRMFKSLFEHLQEGEANKESKVFFEKLQQFAFFPALENLLSSNPSEKEVLSKLLLSEGLGYGALPKGLLDFHMYPEEVRTPLQEHLLEAIEYASDGKSAKLHFTVSPEHRSRFEELVSQLVPKLEKKFGIRFQITFSEQKLSTDTVAVDMDNEFFREADGSMLFRPAGHGALLENLNDLHADIIFIKNVDNVVPDALRGPTIEYKKAIGGLLLSILEGIKALDEQLQGDVSDDLLIQAEQELVAYLGFVPSPAYQLLPPEQKVVFLREVLNRPTRVCGVVKNTGEPGGGPFWCQDEEGNSTLQLVESAQVNPEDNGQMSLFKGSTHFNPVDLVCATKDLQGRKFDLRNFRDMNTGFITEKTKDGKKLKALELPGLWNGAMAFWNTIFVEVPLETFNPVKTVNDLLRPAHQNA